MWELPSTPIHPATTIFVTRYPNATKTILTQVTATKFLIDNKVHLYKIHEAQL
jgi:hypothetical protein